MPLTEIMPDARIRLDIRYATANNVTSQPIYARAACWLATEAATRLHAAADLAAHLGYALKIFDGYRPPEAQWALWRVLPDPRFVADPRRGSSHGRGVAVDLTLVDAQGRELDMGTGFDEMTVRSGHGTAEVSAAALAHRSLLLGIMAAAGWAHNPHEWWHYNLPQPARFPLLSDSLLPRPMMG